MKSTAGPPLRQVCTAANSPPQLASNGPRLHDRPSVADLDTAFYKFIVFFSGLVLG